MRTTVAKGVIIGGMAIAMLGLSPAASRAQLGPPDWLFQNFTGNTCGWTVLSGVTMAYDPSQDATGNGGGSARFTLDYGGTNSSVLVVTVNNVDCCYCNLDTLLSLNDYASVDCDVKWDPTSGVPLSYFNSNGQGIQVDLNNGYGGSPIAVFTIPDAATNGWAHVSAPISTNLGSTNFAGITLIKAYTGNNGGIANFWLDNVELVGRKASPPIILSPVLSPGGTFTLHWTNVGGFSYTVERSTDSVNWSNLLTAYTPGNPANISYTDTNPPPGHAFYRVTSP